MDVPIGFPKEEKDIDKLLKMYRIYDIVFMEQWFYNIQTKMNKEALEAFHDKMKEIEPNFPQFTEFKMDYVKGDIVYSTEKETDISATTLSNGQQSLVTMILFGLLEHSVRKTESV